LASLLLDHSAAANTTEEGIALYESQQFSRAVRAFESAKDQTLSDSRSAYYYALSLNSAGRTDKATAICKQIIARFPRTQAAKQAAAAVKKWSDFNSVAAASAKAREAYLGQKLDGNIGILGIKFEMVSNKPPVVRFVFPGGPAENIVRTGDAILQVDDTSTEKLSKEDVYDLIIGKKGTSVSLTLQRQEKILKESFVRMSIEDLSKKFPDAWRMYSANQ
jgi:C-terminal processing protease CtpA/Prc